jgi:hypothetical protein
MFRCSTVTITTRKKTRRRFLYISCVCLAIVESTTKWQFRYTVLFIGSLFDPYRIIKLRLEWYSTVPNVAMHWFPCHRFRTSELLFGWAWKNKMRRRQHIWILNVILMKKVSLPTFWERYVRSNKKIYKVSLAYLDLQTFPGHSLHCHNFRYIFLRNVKFLRRNSDKTERLWKFNKQFIQLIIA